MKRSTKSFIQLILHRKNIEENRHIKTYLVRVNEKFKICKLSKYGNVELVSRILNIYKLETKTSIDKIKKLKCVKFVYEEGIGNL